MTDRIVASAWWIVVMSIVLATAIAAVLLCYDGLLALVAEHWTRGSGAVASGLCMGTICGLFCQHRNDLLA